MVHHNFVRYQWRTESHRDVTGWTLLQWSLSCSCTWWPSCSHRWLNKHSSLTKLAASISTFQTTSVPTLQTTRTKNTTSKFKWDSIQLEQSRNNKFEYAKFVLYVQIVVFCVISKDKWVTSTDISLFYSGTKKEKVYFSFPNSHLPRP